MAKGNSQKASAPQAGSQHRLEDVERMEALALEKANQWISAIENAMAVWELSQEKPSEFEERAGKLKFIHEELSGWEREMLLHKGKDEPVQERIARLKEFTEICYKYT